jgi:hypothetical protein
VSSRPGEKNLDAIYVRWTWCRAVLHRGWWLVASVYLVVDAHLSASQLVLIGVAQGAVALAFEVPAGAAADTLSRKWSLVVSQVLMRAGRAQLTGAVAGMVGLGLLAWLTDRGTVMVLAGAAMLLLAVYVVVGFREWRFVPVATRRWTAARSILVRGATLVRRSRAILILFAATFLVDGVAGTFGRLYPLRLVEQGLATDPVLWLTALGVLAYLAGAVALRVVQPYIGGRHTLRRGYVAACGVGTVGVLGLSAAPEQISASAAVLLTAGALPLTRTFGTVWVNQQITGDVRATAHSLLAQADYLGTIVCGIAIAGAAGLVGLSFALVACGALLAIAMLLIRSPS